MANSDKWKALARYLSCENVLSCFQSQLQASYETQGLLWTRFTGKILVFSFENAYISMHLGLLSTYAERFHRKRIDLKTLLKVDENENAHISSD